MTLKRCNTINRKIRTFRSNDRLLTLSFLGAVAAIPYRTRVGSLGLRSEGFVVPWSGNDRESVGTGILRRRRRDRRTRCDPTASSATFPKKAPSLAFSNVRPTDKKQRGDLIALKGRSFLARSSGGRDNFVGVAFGRATAA